MKPREMVKSIIVLKLELTIQIKMVNEYKILNKNVKKRVNKDIGMCF